MLEILENDGESVSVWKAGVRLPLPSLLPASPTLSSPEDPPQPGFEGQEVLEMQIREALRRETSKKWDFKSQEISPPPPNMFFFSTLLFWGFP